MHGVTMCIPMSNESFLSAKSLMSPPGGPLTLRHVTDLKVAISDARRRRDAYEHKEISLSPGEVHELHASIERGLQALRDFGVAESDI